MLQTLEGLLDLPERFSRPILLQASESRKNLVSAVPLHYAEAGVSRYP